MSYSFCYLDPKVKVKGKKAVICDGLPSTAALVYYLIIKRVWGEINTRLVEHLIAYVEYINQVEERGQMRSSVERFIAFWHRV